MYYLMAFNHRLDGKRIRRDYSSYEQAYNEFVRHQGNVDALVLYQVKNGKRKTINKA